MSNNVFYFYKGRVALYAILKAMGVKKEDEVILQSFTCVAVPLPIISLGAKLVYADIDPENFNLDLGKLEALITPRTKAIVVQHTFGIPLDMDHLLRIAQKYGLYVIEDCCHTLASQYKGRTVGLFGDAAFYSYEWGKPIIVGVGGCAVVNDQELKEKLEAFYSTYKHPLTTDIMRIEVQYLLHTLILRPSLFWIVRDLFRFFSRLGMAAGTFGNEELEGEMIHLDQRMGRIHQKRLTRNLRKVAVDGKFRLRVASQYEEGLAGIGIEHRRVESDHKVVYLRYPLRVQNKTFLLEHARKRRIEIGDWFLSPVHPLTEPAWDLVHYLKGCCPVAEAMSRQIITLPINRKVGRKDIDRTIAFLSDMKREGIV